MSETEDTPTEEELEEKYSDEPQYTVAVNDKKYSLTEDARESIQNRAKLAYEENPMFSCWWRTGTAEDEQDSDTVHEEGDPILVIETEGPVVPWDRLDQLELEMQDTSSYQEFDAGGSDVDEGNGMKTIKPGEVDPNQGGDDSQEMSRTHFGITPQDFQEVPSPDGERPDRVPPKPMEFDEPTMVMWVPENPDLDHTWSTGEAIAPMYNWVEWNVQQKANQPRPSKDKPDSHDHWESLLKHHGGEVVAKMTPKQKPPEKSEQTDDSDDDDDVPRRFKEGTAGGNNWNV